MHDPMTPDNTSPERREVAFAEDAIRKIGPEHQVKFLLQMMEDMRGTIENMAGRIRYLELFKGSPNQPIRNIVGDNFIGVDHMQDRVNLKFHDDEFKQDFVQLASTSLTTLFGDCQGFFVYNIITVCQIQPPVLIYFLRHSLTCQERAIIRTLCCCDGDSGSGSGSYTHELDQWAAPCTESGSGSANDGTNFVYLQSYIFDNLSDTYDDPIIQLDGAGFCYQLVARNVTAIETTFSTINVMELCSDSDCEDEVPCVSCPGDNYASGVKISGYTNGMFGTLQSDVGGGCTASGTSGAAAWDGVFATWSSSDCAYEQLASASMNIGGGFSVDVGGGQTEVKWVSPGGGAACYWRVRIAFSLNATSSFIEYRKAYGDTPIGTYAYNSTDPASLATCSTGIPTSITIAAV